MNFTGPYIWPTQGNTAVPVGSGTPGPYPAPWDIALPANNYFAGQYQFTLAPNSGGNQDYITGNYRRPFFTTFTEVVGGRVIKLMSVHPSPNATKTAVVNTLPSISVLQPSGPAVVVVTGDFNINIISTFNAFSGKTKGGQGNQGYYMLRQANFGQKISSTNAGTNGSTRVEQINTGTPTAYLRNEGLDNIFVRYDGGLVAPGPQNPRIINPVTGTGEFNSDMLQSLATIAQTTNPTTTFRKDVNYGHIAHFVGVSDHLPVVIDI